MHIHIITLPFNPSEKDYPIESLGFFLLDKELIDFQAHFFTEKDRHYWTILLKYEFREKREPVAKKKSYQPLGLEPADQELYDLLREWRYTYARAKGFPSFIVANNRHLEQIAKQRMKTLKELQKMHGFGKSKVASYGEEILAVVRNFEEKSKPE